MKTLKNKILGGITAIAALVFFAGAASANPINISIVGTSGGNPGGMDIYEAANMEEGDGINMEWSVSGQLNGGGDFELNFSGMLTIISLTDTEAVIEVMIMNDAANDPSTRVTVFGLGVDPNATTSSLSTPGTYLDTWDDGNIPGDPGFADFCATSNNCAGGGGGGIPVGDDDTFRFTITGDFSGGSLTLQGFFIKVQTGLDINTNSFELFALITPKRPTQMPEPASMLLMGTGLLGLGAVRRRRRKAA